MERWEVDPLLTEIHDALYKLGVKAKIQGFFDIPVDHLAAAPVFADYFNGHD